MHHSTVLIQWLEQSHHPAHTRYTCGLIGDSLGILLRDKAHEIDHTIFRDNFDLCSLLIAAAQQSGLYLGGDPGIAGARER